MDNKQIMHLTLAHTSAAVNFSLGPAVIHSFTPESFSEVISSFKLGMIKQEILLHHLNKKKKRNAICFKENFMTYFLVYQIYIRKNIDFKKHIKYYEFHIPLYFPVTTKFFL